MLPAVHLLIGITLGIFLLYLTKDCRALIYCAVGSLLPDIIDKPVGHIVLTNLDNGRIFFHSLTICALIALFGVIVIMKWRHPGLLFIAAGILSHQFADAMWAAPRSWFWPFLGGFPQKYHPYYFQNMFSLEFSSPSEILVIAAALLFFFFLVIALHFGKNYLLRWAAGLVGLLLTAAGVLMLSGLLTDIIPGSLIYTGFRDILICALSFLMGGVAFLLISLLPPDWCGMKDFL